MYKLKILFLLTISLGSSKLYSLPSSPAADQIHSSLCQTAQNLLKRLSAQTAKIMGSQKSEKEKKEEFTLLFQNYFDFSTFLGQVFSPHIQQAMTSQDKRIFASLVTKDAINTYFNVVHKYYKKDSLEAGRCKIIDPFPVGKTTTIPQTTSYYQIFLTTKAYHPENGTPIELKWLFLTPGREEGLLKIRELTMSGVPISAQKIKEYKEIYRKHYKGEQSTELIKKFIQDFLYELQKKVSRSL